MCDLDSSSPYAIFSSAGNLYKNLESHLKLDATSKPAFLDKSSSEHILSPPNTKEKH